MKDGGCRQPRDEKMVNYFMVTTIKLSQHFLFDMEWDIFKELQRGKKENRISSGTNKNLQIRKTYPFSAAFVIDDHIKHGSTDYGRHNKPKVAHLWNFCHFHGQTLEATLYFPK